ncbi:tyrosine-type recombinase/integrase [Mesorhizobium australicum]|uniref:Tyrosine-type recombinase/integrase n=1 Tax=Mesorhizobium australicum TaxID=536018 RepID=A0ACC6SYE3_9HYPH
MTRTEISTDDLHTVDLHAADLDVTAKETRSRTLNRLSARAVETATKPGAYMDGGGLLLRVGDSGGKKWLFRFVSPATGKRREMGLGRADKGYVSLAAAREAAGKARDLVAKQLDPIDEAERQKRERLAEAKKAKPKTFGEFADEWLDQNEHEFSNPKHRAQWRTTLGAKPKQGEPEQIKAKKAKPRKGASERTYAAPLRLKLPAEITTEDVLSVLKPLWNDVPETAKRTQGRIEKIMDAARAKGLYHGPNPARWRGHLDKLLSARSKRSQGHHAALPYEDLPKFITKLREAKGVAAKALEFAILTAARSGEVRGMTWAEVNLAARRWTVPGARMKAGNDHRVPLTDRALEILKEMAIRPAGDNGAALVFPGDPINGRRKPGATGPVQMSDMTLSAVLKRMGRADITVHGFRSCFRDWAEDVARYPFGAIKAALAHTISDKVDAAYRRGDGYDIRTELMATWETYLGSGAGPANVVPLRRA